MTRPNRVARVIVATGMTAAFVLSSSFATIPAASTPASASPVSAVAAATPAPAPLAVEYASTSASGTTTLSGTGGQSTSSDYAHGAQTVWVSVESVTSTRTDDVNSITTSSVTALITRLAAYWKAQSGGQVTVSLAQIETRSLDESSCSGSDVFSDAPQVAFGGRFADSAWRGTHEHLLVLTLEGCGQAGIGTVGGEGGIMMSGNGTGSKLGVPVALHEFGHNLGFGHAGSSVCRTSAEDSTRAADFGGSTSLCPTDEYGDYLDLMGYTMSNATPQLSSAQRIVAGYLTAYRTVTSAVSTMTATVTPLSGSGSTRALRVVDPKSGAGYFLEYRTRSGDDATSTEFSGDTRCTTTRGYTSCARGASGSAGEVRILRVIPSNGTTSAERTTVLAVGAIDSTTRSTHLPAGQTFVSAGRGVWIIVNATNGARGASITVRFSAPSTTRAVLRITRLAHKSGSKTAARARLTARVATSSGAAVRGTVRFYDGSRLIATASVRAGHTASVLAPKSLRVGKHRIRASFTPSTGDYRATTSTAATLKITRR